MTGLTRARPLSKCGWLLVLIIRDVALELVLSPSFNGVEIRVILKII